MCPDNRPAESVAAHRFRTARRRRHAALAVAAALCAGLSGAGVARAAAPLLWAAPVQAARSHHALTGLTCRSVAMCVAVDGGKALLLSTAPLRGGWRRAAPPATSSQITAVSCAAAAPCIGVDTSGDVVSSGNQAAPAWTAANIDLMTPLTGVSCPSASLCVAIDGAGDVLVSTDPSVALAWSLPMPVDHPHRLTAISCPTVTLCVAVDDAGGVVTSTSPARLAAWRTAPLATAGVLTAVSCNTAALCVAVASDGTVYATAAAASAPVTWSATPMDQTPPLRAVSCTDAGLCVTVDGSGNAFESDDPVASSPTWTGSTVESGSGLTGVSCASAGFCLVADSRGRTIAATLPAPAVTPGVGTTVSQTVASLVATVDPHDAAPAGCRFEFGPTTGYGTGAPCTSLPSATGGTQVVAARAMGLKPATTYHFRVVASSAITTSRGPDATFSTPPPPQAHPWISGTPAVGSTLRCWPNAGATPWNTITFAWLTDDVPIAGATAASYVVAAADQSDFLRCSVSIAGGGATSALSGFDAVPSQSGGATLESFVGTPTRRATSVSAPVTCSPHAARQCSITLALTATAIVHHRRETVTVGTATARLAAGATRRLYVTLDRRGNRLLTRRRRLAVTFTVKGTVIGVLTATLRSRALVLDAAQGQVATGSRTPIARSGSIRRSG